MDAGSLKSLRWALAVGGALGLLCTALMLVVNLAVYGHSRAAASFVVRLPSWAVWGAAPPSEVTMLLAGVLCAPLLVTDRWPVKVCAALVARWFAYAQWGRSRQCGHTASGADARHDAPLRGRLRGRGLAAHGLGARHRCRGDACRHDSAKTAARGGVAPLRQRYRLSSQRGRGRRTSI